MDPIHAAINDQLLILLKELRESPKSNHTKIIELEKIANVYAAVNK